MVCFSVIIPTCHRDDLLARCLERLRPGIQTLPSDQYEVIVTDDGSRSTSRAMVENHFPFVRWVAGPGKGPAANRNNGARLASGRFLVFTDDDCVPSSNWIGAFHASIRDDVHVYEGKTTCHAGLRRFMDDAPVNETGGVLPSCNFMIATQLYWELGGFDEAFPTPTMMEDFDLRDRIYLAGERFIFVPDAAVDHPPRRRYVGLRAGAMWRSRVFVIHKWRQRKSVIWWLPVFISKVRISQLGNYPVLDWPLALWYLMLEVTYVIFYQTRWDAEYRNCPAATARGRVAGSAKPEVPCSTPSPNLAEGC